MKIAFFDPIAWDYTVLTPLEHPLGGAQSALCYLATALVAAGEEVSLVNGTTAPGTFAGVRCYSRHGGADPAILNQADVVVALNYAWGRKLRERLRPGIPIVLWSGQYTNMKEVAGLREPEQARAWDAVVLKSEWQAQGFESEFGIDRARITILRNAVSPAFERITGRQEPWFLTGRPPVLAYTSVPYRGLNILLAAFPRIRAAHPGARLQVFSSMKVYQVPEAEDESRALYEHSRHTEGVDYIGSLSQTDLAQALSAVDILAYPATVREVACIAIMEAMAAGLAIVTAELGGVPEITGEFGFLLRPDPDPEHYAAGFAALASHVIAEAGRNPDWFASRLNRQAAVMRATYTWKNRAQEWRRFLGRLVGGG